MDCLILKMNSCLLTEHSMMQQGNQIPYLIQMGVCDVGHGAGRGGWGGVAGTISDLLPREAVGQSGRERSFSFSYSTRKMSSFYPK